MKAKEIQELIDFISKSGLDEVNIETQEFKIKVKKNSEAKAKVETAPVLAIPVNSTSTQPVVTHDIPKLEVEKALPSTTKSNDDSKYIAVKSPMIGTFYRSSTPDSEPFVKVGDSISPGQAVCIIEAMKLFNEIESEVSGTVVKILVDNASPVEYDQPLFLVDPS